jgi:cytochrome c oxidase subunit 4
MNAPTATLRRTYVVIYLALLALLAATIIASRFNLGPLGLAIAIGIAVVKALLIMLYFMHVRFSSRLTWIFASAAFFWLAILIGLVMTDYLSRGWLAGKGM